MAGEGSASRRVLTGRFASSPLLHPATHALQPESGRVLRSSVGSCPSTRLPCRTTCALHLFDPASTWPWPKRTNRNYCPLLSAALTCPGRRRRLCSRRHEIGQHPGCSNRFLRSGPAPLLSWLPPPPGRD